MPPFLFDLNIDLIYITYIYLTQGDFMKNVFWQDRPNKPKQPRQVMFVAEDKKIKRLRKLLDKEGLNYSDFFRSAIDTYLKANKRKNS
jgi:hypothetical protein